MTNPTPTWWWLSFVSEDSFLGAAMVRGTCIATATANAHRYSCNPGGEVFGLPYPDGAEPPEAYRHRLLSREECDELDAAIGGGGCIKLGDAADEGLIPKPHPECSICRRRHGREVTHACE